MSRCNNPYQIISDYLRNKYGDYVHLRSCPFLVNYKKRLAQSAESMGTVRLKNCEAMCVYKVILKESIKDSDGLVYKINNMLLNDWMSMGYYGALIFCFSNHSSFLITSIRGEDNINIKNL